MELIRDLLWLWILGVLGGSAYLAWELLWKPRMERSSPLRTAPSAPGRALTPPRSTPAPGAAAPAAPAVVPAPEHGAAPRPASGAPGSPPVPDSTQRAARLEERGFHVPPRRESERSATRGTEPAGAAQAATPASAPPPAQPGVVRSHTAELDDILKRIDAVLSESAPPQAVATLPGAAEQTVVQPPPTETINRPEAGSPPRSA